MQNSWRMRPKCAFLYIMCTCVVLSLCELRPFSHLPWKSYFSALTFLVSLSCQLIFLSPCTPVSPISSFLYLLILHYFSHSFVDFSSIFAEQTSDIQALQNFILSCLAVLLWLFNIFSRLLLFLQSVPLSLFQLYTVGDKNRRKGQEAPTASIMSFSVVA